ncbi:MAG: NTP transferase domain-containing protein [Planctomycetota bacterium]
MATTHDGLMIGVAILAAGQSRRMGNCKALLDLRGEPVVSAMVRAARSVCGHIAVISGRHHRWIRRAPGMRGVTVRHNPHHARGRASSVRTAAEWMQEVGDACGSPVGLVLWPVDCPVVSEPTLRALVLELWRDSTTSVAPACDGRAGHPLVLGPGGVAAALALPDESSLRDTLAERGVARRLLHMDDAAVLDNIDTPRDYFALRHRIRAIARGGVA